MSPLRRLRPPISTCSSPTSMHPCFRAAVAILYLQSATAATDRAAAITRLENMCEHAGDFKPDQLDDGAVETERAIRAHADELNSPRIYVGDMWDVSHRLASRYPKFSLKFA